MSQTKSTEDSCVLKQQSKTLNGKKRRKGEQKSKCQKKLRQHHRLTQPYS